MAPQLGDATQIPQDDDVVDLDIPDRSMGNREKDRRSGPTREGEGEEETAARVLPQRYQSFSEVRAFSLSSAGRYLPSEPIDISAIRLLLPMHI